MITSLKKHDLVITFRELKGNPKWSICTEPLWFIPFTLFQPFQTLFMYKVGVTDLEIGFILSVGFLLQVVFSLIGGIITDKLGRRKTTVIFDTISWSVACLIWAFSQNFWWFLIASVVNAAFQITNTSWNCLFIEDCPKKHVTNAFTLIQICGMLAVFASPLAIILVGKYSVVPVVRTIYFISAFSMLAKFLILYRFGGETAMGTQRMEETKDVSFWSMFKGYKEVIITIIKSRKMMLVVFFLAISQISQIATNNFFSLYITEDLQLPDNLVAVFPMVRTIIMWMFIIGLQNSINRMSMKKSIILGFGIYIISHIFLVFSPEKSILFVAIYTMLEASAFAIIVPRRDSLMAQFVEERERSRIYGLYYAFMIAIAMPFGSIVGLLSSINGVLPFVFNIGLFILAVAVFGNKKTIGLLKRT